MRLGKNGWALNILVRHSDFVKGFGAPQLAQVADWEVADRHLLIRSASTISW